MRSFSELVASISWSTAILERDSSLLRKLQLGNSRSSFEIPFGQGILQMHLQGEITRNCHATWVQVRIPKPWLVIDMKLILSSRLFLLALTEKQGKSIDCNGSSLPPFSIPSFLRILDIIIDSWWCCQISWIIVQFFRISSSLLTIKNVSKNTHIITCVSRHSNFAAGLSSWTRGNESLMKNVSPS